MLARDVSLNPGLMDSSDNATCARSEPFVFPKLKMRGLSMAHLNKRGFHSSLDEIKIFLGNKTLDVLTLSETWLNETIDDAKLAVEGYVLIRKDRRYGNGGGVAAYIKSNHAFTERPELCCNNLEVLWFEINIPKSKPVLIASVYRPLSTSDADMFFNNFETLLQSIPIQQEYLILGHLNCDMTKNRSHTRRLKSMLYRFELTQLIKQPTRISERSSTLIDIILLSNPEKIGECNVKHLSISDHSLMYAIRKARAVSHNNSPPIITIRNFKRFNADKFKSNLHSVPFHIVETFDDPNTAWSMWKDMFTEVCDEHAPTVQRKVHGSNVHG